MTIRASVIVPVHDDASGLRATLQALAAQTMAKSEFEVVVVDDGSTDHPSTVVAGYTFARLVKNAGPRGSYAARNHGIRSAFGSVLAFTDADCEPDAHWLAAGVKALESDPRMLLAGRIRMPLSPRPTLAAMVDVIHHLDQRRCVETEGYAVTANLMTSRQVIEAAGMFDSTLRSSGDREFTKRAQDAGFPLRYREDVSIVHPPRTRAAEVVRKSIRVGRGSSALRAAAPAGARDRPIYLRRGVVRPRHRPEGRRRLRENGADPGALRWKAVGAAQLVLLQFPQVGAAAAADLRRVSQRLASRIRQLLTRNRSV